ncbi:hypothetical protein Prubr_03150 [Polymorphospora rubra]|uniref:Acyl-CoA thioesterase II n=1 Tax=Polymorphospora rubra TaxID=338584 RepID=A0A810MRK0_9ACTN|nr:hypothetical protein Prubr_03150 [Polymorphospora rubra]
MTSDRPVVGEAAVEQLLELLDLRRLDDTTFLGTSPPVGPLRVYGGQVAGQALVAAGRTVDPSRHVHSLHGYFVRPGDPTAPIEYQVENIRDGRSFSVRRSVAVQHGKTIFFMSASFQHPEEGLDHQTPLPPDVPGPDEVPTMTERLARYPERLGIWGEIPRPIDVRYVGEPGWVRPGDRPAEPHQRVWMRIDAKLPDDPLLHACALTYASDLTLLDAVLSTHGEVWGPAASPAPASTTPCGSTGPSAPTNGSSTTAPARPRPAAADSPPAGCSAPTAGTSPAPYRRGWSAVSRDDHRK